MKELLNEFKSESHDLCKRMISILEDCENNPGQCKRLEEFGQLADRMMGGAKIFIMNVGDDSGRMEVVAAYTELEKLLGYKGAQLPAGSGLLPVVVGLLLDATELLARVVDSLGTEDSTAAEELVAKTFLDRLEWVNSQFDASISGAVPLVHKRLDQSQIQKLIETLKRARFD